MKPVGSRSSDLLPLTPLSGWVFQSVVKPGEHAEKTKALLPAHSPESRSRAASQGTTGAEFGSWSWQPAAALAYVAQKELVLAQNPGADREKPGKKVVKMLENRCSENLF